MINLNKIPVSIQLLGLLGIVYANILIVQNLFSLEEKWQNTYYSFSQTLSFFVVSSIVILIINLVISKKASEQLGFVFLGIMTVKLIASYVFIAPALELKSVASEFEKINFFIYFLVFLAIDVYLTIQILNKKN
ncbi:MAG: hypothetical protein MUF43_02115 [Flavobacterium sp.]|jgi:hypothetical protein|nr:hypothetical protein [Flavobacterium sp.]